MTRKPSPASRARFFLPILFLLIGTTAWAAPTAEESPQGDPVAIVILSLAVILIAAKFGGHLASRFRQPPVLGELMAGVILGNLPLVGFHGL